MEPNNLGELKNITYNSDDHTLFTPQSISLLQSEISSKMAKYINKEYTSKKNDLNLCLSGDKIYHKLEVYYDILEQIKYCSSCYEEWHPSEVIDVIKTNLNRSLFRNNFWLCSFRCRM